MLLGNEDMTTKKHRPIAVSVSEAVREREVKQEIETFLNALRSYPECFERDPYISFEQHLFSLVACAHVARDRHRDRDVA